MGSGGSEGVGCFLLPEGADEQSMARLLECSVVDRSRIHRRWYDTFDWRLWNAGLVIEVEGELPALRVTARDAGDHRVRWEAWVESVPTTASQLPHGPWRRSLAPLLGNRALLVVGSEVVEEARLAATDEAGKTLALVLVDRRHSGDVRARVVSMVGYERAAHRLRRLLAGTPGVTSVDHPLCSATVGGRRPGVDEGGFGSGLEADWPAHRAVAELLERLHATMTDNAVYLLGTPPDSEFLHDFRVAVRRSRSILRLARGVIAPQDRRQARRLLGRLQASTGPARDLDVMVEDLHSFRDELGADEGRDLEPLLALVASEQAVAQAEVARVLASEDHAQADRTYREVLVRMRDPAPATDAPEATRAVGELAAERITRAHRRMVKAGRAVEETSPPSAVHEVRILGKELRYALEAFTAVLDADAARDFVRSLKRFQNLLGAYNDAGVQARAIEDLSHHLAGTQPDAVRSVMAAGLLVHRLGERQAELRRGFSDALGSFDSKATRRQLRAMLAPASPRRP